MAITRRLLVVSGVESFQDGLREMLGELAETTGPLVIDGAEDGDALQIPSFQIDPAVAAPAARALVETAVALEYRYALAIVDATDAAIDAVTILDTLWGADPDLEVVLVTSPCGAALADAAVPGPERLLLLRVPLDREQLQRLAASLTEKWVLRQQANASMEELERMVERRTRELADANAALREEMAERQRVEVELRHAQKLEAVGRLAAGVAHEINTPIQYIGDNLSFVREVTEGQAALIAHYRQALQQARQAPLPAATAAALTAAEEQVDLPFLSEKAPDALAAAFAGIERVSTIVRSMKELAHPGPRQQAPADLHRALRAAVEVSRHEYKLVADVELDFGDLPDVTCHIGDLSQVFINLLVNAAHAIADAQAAVGSGAPRGRITVRTRALGDAAVIEIADTGCGIPANIRDNIFEPFFTTKSVGRGTGQGLALAQSVVEGRHRGSLSFESEPGVGTTFRLHLPIRGAGEAAASASGTPL